MYPPISASKYARLMGPPKRQADSLRNHAISDFRQQAGIATRHTLMAAHRLARSLARPGKPTKQQGA